MMAIDEDAASPTFGRLYVVWSELSEGGVTVVLSSCDTRQGGFPNAGRCDDAGNWSGPADVTSGAGSHQLPDVAVGPGGRVHVVWWDFSAANAVEGKTCDPAARDCRADAGWTGATGAVATLDATGGDPVPFLCPIVAQPGGRAHPLPDVAVDRSGGPRHGRVYVTWNDLTGAGSTRCDTDAQGRGTPPLASHRHWNAYVASAVGQLPAGGSSAAVGTRVLVDGEGGGQSPSDDWFPAVAVDQVTGQPWVSVYSTDHDGTRRTVHHYARSVNVAGNGALSMGSLTRASTASSDNSGNTCCTVPPGDDYGDYTALDATEGVAYPVWSDKRGASGEAFVLLAQQPGLQLAHHALAAVEAAGGPGAEPPGSAARDTTRPRLRGLETLTLTPAGAARRGLIVEAEVSEAVRATGVLVVSRKDAVRLRLAPPRGGRRAILSRARGATTEADVLRLRFTIPKRSVSRLRRLRRLRVTVEVTVRDTAGNTSSGRIRPLLER